MDKIENSMSPGIHAGDEVRPSHRTLRRNARRQMLVRSLLRQLGEVRHLPRLHEAVQQLRIHPVDPEDDELLLSMPLAVGSLTRIEQEGQSTQRQRAKNPDSFLQMHASFNVPGPVERWFPERPAGPAENNRTQEGYLGIR
jgi:hypothetical protein